MVFPKAVRDVEVGGYTVDEHAFHTCGVGDRYSHIHGIRREVLAVHAATTIKIGVARRQHTTA